MPFTSSDFRKRTDIEAVFHRMLVEPKDCDAFRFLRWPNGDLSRELEEYRMVKHLFGASSSLSIATFCLIANFCFPPSNMKKGSRNRQWKR